ncbi:MAG: 50S ribosomal protein L10 [Planctomycetota bacterium]
MPSVLNEMLLRELTDSYEGKEGVFIISMTGLSMKENEGLRNQLAEHGVGLRVVPNKLALRAFASVGLEFSKETFRGASIGVATGSPEDAINAAKVVKASDVAKKGKVVIRGGALEGNVLGTSDALALADVPDKNTLRAKILGCLNGPAQNLASLIAAPGASLARVVNAHSEKAEG